MRNRRGGDSRLTRHVFYPRRLMRAKFRSNCFTDFHHSLIPHRVIRGMGPWCHTIHQTLRLTQNLTDLLGGLFAADTRRTTISVTFNDIACTCFDNQSNGFSTTTPKAGNCPQYPSARQPSPSPSILNSTVRLLVTHRAQKPSSLHDAAWFVQRQHIVSTRSSPLK